MEVAHRRSWGAAFHSLGAATSKLISSKVSRLVFSITRRCWSLERSERVGEYEVKSSAKCCKKTTINYKMRHSFNMQDQNNFQFCVIWFPVIKSLVYMLERWDFLPNDPKSLNFHFKVISSVVLFDTLPGNLYFSC